MRNLSLCLAMTWILSFSAAEVRAQVEIVIDPGNVGDLLAEFNAVVDLPGPNGEDVVVRFPEGKHLEIGPQVAAFHLHEIGGGGFFNGSIAFGFLDEFGEPLPPPLSVSWSGSIAWFHLGRTITVTEPFIAHGLFFNMTISNIAERGPIGPNARVEFNLPDGAVVGEGSANTPPSADAGESQAIHAGEEVTLNGSGSSDDGGTENLTYAWTLDVPDDSEAELSGEQTVSPSFTADLPGDYVAHLVVTDGGGLSDSDDVSVSSLNAPPNANAGPDQGTYVGGLVDLDGSQSDDQDGDALTYSWTLSTPEGSASTLNNDAGYDPFFIPDVPGTYDAFLTVSDTFGASDEDQVIITIITGDDFAENETANTITTVASLPPSSVTTSGGQNAVGNLLIQAVNALQGGNVDLAKKKLGDALERTDGCALRGSVDGSGGGQIKQDYVATCADQQLAYPSLLEALMALDP